MPLEDYIINAFCLIDDLYKEILTSNKIRKSGYAPILLDSEIITMLIVGEFLSLDDDKKIWLHFKSSYLALFPNLEQIRYKVFNKQANHLWNVVRIIHSKLLNKIGSWDLYLADGLPLPICHYARANKSKLFKDKAVKYFCALTETSVPANATVIADKGFIGKDFACNLKEQANITLLTPLRKNMTEQIPAKLSKLIVTVRKRIETTLSQLTEKFNLNKTKVRSLHGLLGRINRKILSYTVALFFNYQIVKDQFTQLEHLIQA